MTDSQQEALRAQTPLLSLNQTAKWLQVSPWTVRRFVERGQLEMVLVGGQLRFEQKAVEAFIEANRRGGPK